MAMRDDPSDDAVARILEASTPGPEVLRRLTGARGDGPPLPGEIWRIGRDEALLVWIRRTLVDAVDVIPAVLDVELADQESIVLPSDSTPFGLPLALLTGVRGHVGLPAFLERVGYVDVAAQVQEVMSAARDGRTPHAVDVGLPIESEDDQRIEYRQVIADLLADLAPSRWPDADPMAGALSGRTDHLTELLAQNLPDRHLGAWISSVPHHHVTVDDQISLSTCARVTYLDTSVIVAVLEGANLETAVRLAPLPHACLNVVNSEPDADAVAVAERSVDWPTVVLRVPQLRTAFEPPGGPEVAPRLAAEPLPVVDALAKYLDSQVTAWDVVEPADSNIQNLNFRQFALQGAEEAVAAIATEGSRARITAKKSAWTNMPEDLSSIIAEALNSIVANESTDADAILDDLVERGTQ